MALKLNSLGLTDMNISSETPKTLVKENDTKLRKIEIISENILFNSRWIMAPIFYGMMIPIVIGIFNFFRDAYRLLKAFLIDNEPDTVVESLKMVDSTFVCGLLLVTMITGYEIFVSKLDVVEHPDYPNWMREMSFSKLKILVLVTTIPMTVIRLLTDLYQINTVSDRELIVTIIINFTFVLTAIGVAYMDKLLHSKES